MHVLPRVRELEERFPDELVVIGVHAGKYSAERVTANIALASDRLGVHHAVVNDRQFRVWRDYAVDAWPTVALVDPEGYLVGVQPGEFPVEPMAEAITRVIADAEAAGTLTRGPDPIAAPPSQSAEGSLRFPGRVVLAGDRAIVADTGNGRVLELQLEPDGTAAVVARYDGFAEPQGLVATEQHIYVADRSAHCVIGIDRATGERRPVAGTGVIAEGRMEAGGATERTLRSPWGLATDRFDNLVVAMAGAHQLWRVDIAADALQPLAGMGGEDLRDGPAEHALLAQPTGLSRSGDTLAFVDPESSAVRLLDLASGEVRTLVGTGLFDFGDRDGVGDEVLLQHPEDVAWHADALAVADTYNDRIKRVDPVTRACEPWPGDLGSARALAQPSGIVSDGERLWVADTNNHRIVIGNADGSAGELEIVE